MFKVLVTLITYEENVNRTIVTYLKEIIEIKKVGFGIKFVDNRYCFYNFILQER
jgi:hypothetical protein